MLDPSLPDLVRGDAGRLRQVLLNLGGNAVKFTQQGEVAIECKVAREDDAQGVTIRCEVRDTGMGIPATPPGCALQTVHAGGFVDHAPIRRHRPWAVDRQAAG